MKSPQYRAKLAAAGISCGEDIKTLDDVRRLPFSDVTDLRDGYPLPLLCVEPSEVVRVHASSGTTGKRKILAYTQKDVDTFALQMARCYELAGLTTEDRMQIAVGYGLWTAGAGFQLGSERFGALTIPVGPGNIDMQLQLLVDMQTTCIAAPPRWPCSLPRKWSATICATKSRSGRLFSVPSRTASKCARASLKSSALSQLRHCGHDRDVRPRNGPELRGWEGIHYWRIFSISRSSIPTRSSPFPKAKSVKWS